MATEPDKVDSGVLGTLIAVLAFGVLATALAVTALARTEQDALESQRRDTNDEFAQLKGAQEADLNLPTAYIDEQAGVVRLPIDRAMQVVVRELRQNPDAATPKKPTAAGEHVKESAETKQGTQAEGGADNKQNEAHRTAAKPPPRPKPALDPEPPKQPAKAAPAPEPPSGAAPKPRAPTPQPSKPLAPPPTPNQ